MPEISNALRSDFTDRIRPPANEPISEDSMREEAALADPKYLRELEKMALENRRLELENKRFEEEKDLRRKVTKKIYYLVVGWLFFVACFLIGESQCSSWRLSDGVNITLLTTTTFNILGMLYIVLSYLFPKPVGKDKIDVEK